MTAGRPGGPLARACHVAQRPSWAPSCSGSGSWPTRDRTPTATGTAFVVTALASLATVLNACIVWAHHRLRHSPPTAEGISQ